MQSSAQPYQASSAFEIFLWDLAAKLNCNMLSTSNCFPKVFCKCHQVERCVCWYLEVTTPFGLAIKRHVSWRPVQRKWAAEGRLHVIHMQYYMLSRFVQVVEFYPIANCPTPELSPRRSAATGSQNISFDIVCPSRERFGHWSLKQSVHETKIILQGSWRFNVFSGLAVTAPVRIPIAKPMRLWTMSARSGVSFCKKFELLK